MRAVRRGAVPRGQARNLGCCREGPWPDRFGGLQDSDSIANEDYRRRYRTVHNGGNCSYQGAFRLAVTEAYARSCAATGEHSLPVLDAAHIQPYADGGAHEITNGLLLRADLHRLYDAGYVTVTPDYEFRVSPALRDEYANGRIYYDLEHTLRAHRATIRLPANPAHRPDRDRLAWHAGVVFRG